MPDKTRLLAQIENAAECITPFWPLKTFIATNPLSGFEHLSFEDAVEKGSALFGGNGLPTRTMGQKALKEDKINPAILKNIIAETLGNDKAAHIYNEMTSGLIESPKTPSAKLSKLNALMIKYLAAFLDEGQSAWQMPRREQGFYKAWKNLAKNDDQISNTELLKTLPENALDSLFLLLEGIEDKNRENFLEKHLAALPGWSGFVKWRARQHNYPWQKQYPVSLTDYLAVRLSMANMLNDDGLSTTPAETDKEGLYWLKAWEETYRTELSDQLKKTWDNDSDPSRPEAQFVFCIDVRSEVFRRNLEKTGHYDTYGFAGFFGVALRHTEFGEDIAADSCPVLLSPQFESTDQPCCGHEKKAQQHLHGKKTIKGFKSTLQKLKQDIAAPFATVEATGALFGLGMATRTFSPHSLKKISQSLKALFIPHVELEPITTKTNDSALGLSLSERIFHAEAALKIMGLTKNFAPFVFLTGHGSETENNPYAAGLDCGACGGNHGGPNARLMAAVFNDPAVREGLIKRGIAIPDDTLFIGALHNTTTDEVSILDHHEVPGKIIDDLIKARQSANLERCKQFSTKHSPQTRASDWAEVRPEWGLARNAAFIIGPRSMTQNIDLGGRTFLHSYNYESDPDGKALQIIMTAPMVVAEWINTQYYFSSVDNAVYGSGSKTTHNVVGKIGVMQGNASDLMTGLPLQSVMHADGQLYHEPLRLMTIVKAPLSRVTKLIAENDILQTLFDNGWVALMVIDPDNGKFMRYQGCKVWQDIDKNRIFKTDVPIVKKNNKELEPA